MHRFISVYCIIFLRYTAAGQTFDDHTYQAYYADMVTDWDFNVDSGTTAKDQSGNSNDLTLTAGTIFTTNANGQNSPNSLQSLKIDPAGAHTAATVTGNLGGKAPTGDFTISLWLWSTDYGATADGEQFVDDAWPSVGPLAAGSWKVAIDDYTAGKLDFNYKDLANEFVAIPTPAPQTWNQVTAVCSTNSTNNTAKIGIYLNGNLAASTVLAHAVGSPGVNACSSSLGSNNVIDIKGIVGSGGIGGSDIYYVDNVRLYGRALSVAEIQERYFAESKAHQTLALNPMHE